jgi:hypothetical protein
VARSQKKKKKKKKKKKAKTIEPSLGSVVEELQM